MPYYVVNAGRGRATHISRERVHGLALTLWSGSASTLCGLPATRDVSDVFSPASHTIWLARRVRTAELRLVQGASHFGALEALPDVLQWLVAQDGPRAGRSTNSPGVRSRPAGSDEETAA